MKKVIVTLLVIVLTVCLVGCTSETTETTETTIQKVNDSCIYIWTDEETGVQYIVYEKAYGYAGMGGITPRLNADGTLYGCDKGGE